MKGRGGEGGRGVEEEKERGKDILKERKAGERESADKGGTE